MCAGHESYLSEDVIATYFEFYAALTNSFSLCLRTDGILMISIESCSFSLSSS